MGHELAMILQESGLDFQRGKAIQEQFAEFETVAADWKATAATIVVTSVDQVDKMKLARTGRLILRKKRIAVEHLRKHLKEQPLREGKAIDAIAKQFKAMIEPTEKYLAEQETFGEREAARLEAEAKAAAEQKAAEEKAEADRIAAEERKAHAEADRKERERIEAENAELKATADAALAKQAELVEEQKRLEEVAEKAKQDAIKAEKKAKADQARAQVETREAAERAAQKKIEEAAAAHAKILEAEKAKRSLMVTCPHCGETFIQEARHE